MISIIQQASEISDGSTVYKIAGIKPYTLKRGLKIFRKGGYEIFLDKNVIALHAGGYINVVTEFDKLRLDFNDASEALEYLHNVTTNWD